MGFTVNTRGMRKLKKRLGKLSEEVRDGALRAVTESGDAAADDMRDRVPEDTGDLHDSIRSEVNKGNLVAEVGPRGKDVYYGYFVEVGTEKMPAQPYAQPAAEAERKRFPKRVERYVGRRLK